MATALQAQVPPQPPSRSYRGTSISLPKKESRSQTSLLLLTIHPQATHGRGKAETSSRAPVALLVLALGGSESGQISPLPCSLRLLPVCLPLLSLSAFQPDLLGGPPSQQAPRFPLSSVSLAAASSFPLQPLVPSSHFLPSSLSNTYCTVITACYVSMAMLGPGRGRVADTGMF